VRELLRSNEIVFLSWADALLKSEDIEIFVLDGHMSVLEGSAGAILRRVMVADEDYDRARRLLEEAGEGDRLV
jgi:integrase